MKITKFDRHNKKISLSMKEYQREQEHREVEQYLNNSTETLNSLGALIHEALQSRQAEEAAKNRNGNAGEAATTPEESQEDNREG